MQQVFNLLGQRSDLLIGLLVAAAVMLVAQTLGLAAVRGRDARTKINKRLQLLGDVGTSETVLVELRRERGLTEAGRYALPLKALNRLILQSGINIRRQLVITILLMLAISAGCYFVTRSPLLSALAGIGIGIVLSLMLLSIARKRRQAAFGEQLPDAVDLMIRSLRAGHPVPVAISMVAREMSDPIGTEFGLVADEMTFGLDLETALRNLNARVGQQDLPFIVVAVSIQSRTGGNLAEVLTNLSKIIRDRFKLRRRVHAMSAEGRTSAFALSIIPLIVFSAVNLLTPSFYGSIKNDPIVIPVIVATLALWATGIFIIFRLVNFRY